METLLSLQPIVNYSVIKRVIAWIFVTSLLLVVFSLATTVISLRLALSGELESAAIFAQLAKPGSVILSTATGGNAPIISGWPAALDIIASSSTIAQNAEQLLQEYRLSGEFSLTPFASDVEKLIDQVATLAISLERVPFLGNNSTITKARLALARLQLLVKLGSVAQQDRQKWLILIQGEDELRPGGGFIGAYAELIWQDGKLATIITEDIYDAAGQMDNTFTPPPGLQEYTSGGEGWKVQDANWSPDHGVNANVIQAMMTNAGKAEYDAIISVNTSLLSDLLAIIGDVPLPEYQTVLNPTTVSEILDQHRVQFFPGSREKATLFSQLIPRLLLQIATTNHQQRFALLALLNSAITKKQIQLHFKDPTLQTLASSALTTGTFPPQPNDTSLPTDTNQPNAKPPQTSLALPLAIVEANVGINKANRWISRQLEIEDSPTQIRLMITWTNTATPSATDVLASEPNSYNTNASQPKHTGRLSNTTKPVGAAMATHSAYVNYLRVMHDSSLILQSAEGDIIAQSFGGSTDEGTITLIDTFEAGASSSPIKDLASSTTIATIPYLMVTQPGQSTSATFVFTRENTLPIHWWLQSGTAPYSLMYKNGKKVMIQAVESDLLLPSN